MIYINDYVSWICRQLVIEQITMYLNTMYSMYHNTTYQVLILCRAILKYIVELIVLNIVGSRD